MSTIPQTLAEFVGHNYPIRFVTGLEQRAVRFRRRDGLVDGGTIEHLEELQASRRMLHDALEPGWRNFL